MSEKHERLETEVLPYTYFKERNEKLYGFNIYDPGDHQDDKELVLLGWKEFAKAGVVPHWLVREHSDGVIKEVYCETTQQYGAMKLSFFVSLDCLFDPPGFDDPSPP
jgi:hypothetical protein